MKEKCCTSPRIEPFAFNLEEGTQQDICSNCGATTEWYEYEPTSEFSFDNMPDHYIVEDMLKLISYFSTHDVSYSDYFENDVFELRPYYWGDDEDKAHLPNFRHKKSGLEIRWYKYIGRGMTVNNHVCPNCFFNIFAECMNSLRGDKK